MSDKGKMDLPQCHINGIHHPGKLFLASSLTSDVPGQIRIFFFNSGVCVYRAMFRLSENLILHSECLL